MRFLFSFALAAHMALLLSVAPAVQSAQAFPFDIGQGDEETTPDRENDGMEGVDESEEGLFESDNDRQAATESPEPLFRLFIDPGHGGVDLGGRSEKMALEKNLTLKLARLIEKKLKKRKEDIAVIFTREDDIEVRQFDRIEKANAGGGSLFLSLHASDAGQPTKRPIYIYIHDAQKRGDSFVAGSGRWDRQNLPYAKKNEIFAKLVADKLSKVASRPAQIVPLGHLPLGGLSMPGLIVEVVDLANPEDQMRLDEKGYLEELAAGLAKGVESYYTRFSPALPKPIATPEKVNHFPSPARENEPANAGPEGGPNG